MEEQAKWSHRPHREANMGHSTWQLAGFLQQVNSMNKIGKRWGRRNYSGLWDWRDGKQMQCVDLVWILIQRPTIKIYCWENWGHLNEKRIFIQFVSCDSYCGCKKMLVYLGIYTKYIGIKWWSLEFALKFLCSLPLPPKKNRKSFLLYHVYNISHHIFLWWKQFLLPPRVKELFP